MAIFDRIRRTRAAERRDAERASAPIPEHLLPEINQRVTVSAGGTAPVPSRIEDVRANSIQLAYPAIELGFGDALTITWEREDAWFSLDTHVTGLDPTAAVPTALVAASGRLSRFDERRRDVRRAIELPVELRVVRSRAIDLGRELQTFTTEVSSENVRFMSSAPFAPGDLVEATIRVGEATDDVIRARMRVIRVDTVPGEWRSSCTVTFDEVLRSDRARLVAIAASGGMATTPIEPPMDTPTADGVGGRDEPRSLSDLQGVLEWLERDRSHNEDGPAR